ncbi:hypothetical protein OCU04_008194 [Sclerotinia nivalis]|uniref:Uncharacterized protein n=1 Tax=Sclerotinia nivalis TaxID=352851 RepID=A0A9X0AHP1_9HELO|nr:hypothetical protein OCU04_008194 [Sclerotinia nivalis]
MTMVDHLRCLLPGKFSKRSAETMRVHETWQGQSIEIINLAEEKLRAQQSQEPWPDGLVSVPTAVLQCKRRKYGHPSNN